MNYYRAYKFLKLRAKGENPFKAIEDLEYSEQQKIKSFLSYNHNVKFI